MSATSFSGLKRRALSLGAANAFDFGMQFLLPVVLARCLDAATFGEYRLLWLAVGTVLAIATLGMPQGLYYFLPRSDAATKRLYIHQTILYLAGTGLIGAWLVSPWNPFLPAAIQPLAHYGPLVPAFMALWIVAMMLELLPTVDERIAWQAKTTIALSALRGALLAVGAFASSRMDVLLWLLLGVVLIKLGLLAWYIARHHGLGGSWFDRERFSGQVRHCVPLGMSSTLYGLRSQSDQWVAASVFTIANFAAFSVAAVIAPLVNLFRISVNDVFLPSMSRMQATGDVAGMMDMNGRANALVGTFVCPMLAFAFAFANELVTVVYTAVYVDAAPVMRLYIIGLAAGVVEIGSLLLLLRQGAFALRVNICALVMSVLLSWFAAQHFGLPGAALGSVLAIYFDRFVTLKRIERETGIPLARLQQWRVLALLFAFSALAAGFAWVVVEQMLMLRAPLARLAAGAACLAAVYGTLHSLTGPNRGWIGALLNQGNRA